MALKSSPLLLKNNINYFNFAVNRISTWWSHLELGPPDQVLGLNDTFNRDTNPNKVNLGPGVYRDDNGKPYVLSVVRKAEKILYDKNLDKEYAPISGIPEFCQLAIELALGKDNPRVKARATATVQGISGTGSLRIGIIFLSFFAPKKVIYVPSPTWMYHIPIISHGGLEMKYYDYFDPKTCRLDIEGVLRTIDKIPEKSNILFHACAHNPTGFDPNPEQWAEISKVVKKRNLFPFFDMAYQGFASGDINKDAYAVRLFLKDGHEMALAQSFSKNMGLYGERCGTFSVILNDNQDVEKVLSQLRILLVPLIASPPIHGARIAKEILSDQKLREEWLVEVHEMANRIISVRTKLRDNLEKAGSSQNWKHITDQTGMFCYTGLTSSQASRLTKEFSVYLPTDGRISMAGVSSKNVEYVAKAMHEVTK